MGFHAISSFLDEVSNCLFAKLWEGQKTSRKLKKAIIFSYSFLYEFLLFTHGPRKRKSFLKSNIFLLKGGIDYV